MRGILFLAHRAPFPPDRGDRIRSFHILRELSAVAPVHLVAFADSEADAAAAEALRPFCRSMFIEVRRRSRLVAAAEAFATRCPISVPAFASAGLSRRVDTLLAEEAIDTIFAFSSQMAQFVPADIGERRFVMDFVDVDSAKFEAYADQSRPPLRWLYLREGYRLSRWERKVAARAHLSLFVSEAEAALFRSRSFIRPSRVAVLENGVDLERYDPSRPLEPLGADERGDGPLIVFTGQMDYPPNAEAAIGYARGPFAAIRRVRPDARFAIVGRSPGRTVRALAALQGVEVTGDVPDIRRWLQAADLVVAPLQVARGIQNKVLEAMASGRPVIASPAAFEGIDAAAGDEIIVAETERAQADAALALLGNRQLAEAIGAAARRRMAERYGWAARLARLTDYVSGTSEPVPA